jgi:hypothetical protein
MSRATSGIQYEGAQSGANYSLYQGQTVDEAGPDGACVSCRLHSDAGWERLVGRSVRVQSHSYSRFRQIGDRPTAKRSPR